MSGVHKTKTYTNIKQNIHVHKHQTRTFRKVAEKRKNYHSGTCALYFLLKNQISGAFALYFLRKKKVSFWCLCAIFPSQKKSVSFWCLCAIFPISGAEGTREQGGKFIPGSSQLLGARLCLELGRLAPRPDLLT